MSEIFSAFAQSRFGSQYMTLPKLAGSIAQLPE